MIIFILYIFTINEIILFRQFFNETLERLLEFEPVFHGISNVYTNENKFHDINKLLTKILYDIQYLSYKFLRMEYRYWSSHDNIYKEIPLILQKYKSTYNTKYEIKIYEIEKKFEIHNILTRESYNSEHERLAKKFTTAEKELYKKYNMKSLNHEILYNIYDIDILQTVARLSSKAYLCRYKEKMIKNKSSIEFKVHSQSCINNFNLPLKEMTKAINKRRDVENMIIDLRDFYIKISLKSQTENSSFINLQQYIINSLIEYKNSSKLSFPLHVPNYLCEIIKEAIYRKKCYLYKKWINLLPVNKKNEIIDII